MHWERVLDRKLQESKNIIKYYFEQEHFKLIKGDTFRVLKKFEDKTVNTIFADLPYFLSKEYCRIDEILCLIL